MTDVPRWVTDPSIHLSPITFNTNLIAVLSLSQNVRQDLDTLYSNLPFSSSCAHFFCCLLMSCIHTVFLNPPALTDSHSCGSFLSQNSLPDKALLSWGNNGRWRGLLVDRLEAAAAHGGILGVRRLPCGVPDSSSHRAHSLLLPAVTWHSRICPRPETHAP